MLTLTDVDIAQSHLCDAKCDQELLSALQDSGLPSCPGTLRPVLKLGNPHGRSMCPLQKILSSIMSCRLASRSQQL